MRRITSILIFIVCLGFIPALPVSAGLFSSDTLVSIDENKYTIDDFKRWWNFWKEEGEALPETPTPYINWLLLSREGERMQLHETPGFMRQTRIFLQSRALLMLKYEEVDSQIKVTDDTVRARYDEQYQPRWLVQRLTFKDETAAAAAWAELNAGNLKVDDLGKRSEEQGGPIATNENWLRPKEIDPGWVAIFKKLKVGELVNPEEYGHGPTLYHLKELKEGDDEDFAILSEGLSKDLWKEEEDRLTSELLTRLRKKYNVAIDEERLAALDINGPEDSFTDEPVITSTEQNVSEKEFMVVIRRLIATRPPIAAVASIEEEVKNLKTETAANIIGQSVTNWESLDRRFEEKEPFKWEYNFNYRHRLKNALERRLFGPEAKVSEEEMKQHYDANIHLYTQPTVVKLYIIDETQGPIERIWADVAVGKNFQEVLNEHLGHSGKQQEAPANHLDPEVGEVVKNLIEGETSQIFTAQGVKVIVHLVERIPEGPVPFERVKNSIRTKLFNEKLNLTRTTFLDTVKSRSEIEINQRNWKKIQQELGGVE
jgi:hypothetical protein